ncbi:MAG: ferrous iron transport protein A [Clostridia bacterium]|nr:ferrous iron transport protein A [Clostridia bacterium]
MRKEKSLAELLLNEEGRVSAFFCDASMHRRLLDIGMTVGSKVACVGKSPFGDPCLYLVRGCRIAIRKSDAKDIIIE